MDRGIGFDGLHNNRTVAYIASGYARLTNEGDPMDFTGYDDEQLDALRVEVLTEIERRQTLASAPERADAIAREYGDAIGREDGGEWVQPQGAHDAYPSGSSVLHNGKVWESLIPANVWEPGVSGWREVAEPDPETGEPGVPEWVAPTGGHDAYQTGDRVTFEGQVYESVINGNVWSPRDYPAGWKTVA